MPILAVSSAALLAAASAPITSNVAMFERVDIASGLRLYTVGVQKDTRCADRDLCLNEERLVVAALVYDGQRGAGFAIEMGVPVRVAGGWLTLVSATGKPRVHGALPLSEYRLSYVFEPDQPATDAR